MAIDIKAFGDAMRACNNMYREYCKLDRAKGNQDVIQETRDLSVLFDAAMNVRLSGWRKTFNPASFAKKGKLPVEADTHRLNRPIPFVPKEIIQEIENARKLLSACTGTEAYSDDSRVRSRAWHQFREGYEKLVKAHQKLEDWQRDNK